MKYIYFYINSESLHRVKEIRDFFMVLKTEQVFIWFLFPNRAAISGKILKATLQKEKIRANCVHLTVFNPKNL